MLGGTVWADWHPNRVPAFLRGIGLEAEARDISLGRQAAKPSNFRQDTAGGGVIYNWRHFNNFQPYAKYLIQLGSIDFRLKNDPAYAHDTRTVLTPGLGFEVHAVGNLWARADYEYQFWNNLFGQTLDPQGFTFGVAYRFSGPGRR